MLALEANEWLIHTLALILNTFVYVADHMTSLSPSLSICKNQRVVMINDTYLMY